MGLNVDLNCLLKNRRPYILLITRRIEFYLTLSANFIFQDYSESTIAYDLDFICTSRCGNGMEMLFSRNILSMENRKLLLIFSTSKDLSVQKNN